MAKKDENRSTRRLTGRFCLVDIPDNTIDNQSHWKFRFLAILNEHNQQRSPALKEFNEWRKKNFKEFRKLVRAMTYAATHEKHLNSQFIKEDREGRGGFELRNNRCKLRLLFFYDTNEDQIIVCTNTFRKSDDRAQNKAFAKCARLKDAYFESKGKT